MSNNSSLLALDVWHSSNVEGVIESGEKEKSGEKSLGGESDNFLGQVLIPVAEIRGDEGGSASGEYVDTWFPLCPFIDQNGSGEVTGELRLVLKRMNEKKE